MSHLEIMSSGVIDLAIGLLYVALRLLLNMHTWPTLIAGSK